ncbi:hypothetical protein OH799_01415 [Nocardia sp. NBC_00881]|uniref:hypothetical protein n=1 Tax=Nocardia sp. NBC_00881 TaxID=2975995 RepID=UPI00386484A7|nr:hypothetical protein OH799_01415 [Nocardia sp. NBC_00881]
MNEQLLDRFTIMAPTGNRRQMRRAVPLANTTLLMGWTDPGRCGMSLLKSAEHSPGTLSPVSRTPPRNQEGDIITVTVQDGVPMLAGVPLTDVELANTVTAGSESVPQSSSDEELRSSWEARLFDVFRYREHRRPAA